MRHRAPSVRVPSIVQSAVTPASNVLPRIPLRGTLPAVQHRAPISSVSAQDGPRTSPHGKTDEAA